MTVQLAKNAIDIGIVVTDPAKALAFYRDTLGFEHVGTSPMGGITLERLMCGDTMVKLVTAATPPTVRAPGGGITGAYGIRYWTISVKNLDEILSSCGAAGYKVVVPRRNARPGLDIGIVEDPDGNWVEFIQETA
jgi:catechol 2,3-dioxygenase-like lactoylglutathione lyase family enzyme